MTEREELENAMAVLDQQRTLLGDAAVEAALAGLQQKLSALEKGEPASLALAGERRVLTVLFCDVKGSTAMAEKLDPEEWADIMKHAFAYLIPPVTHHDGIVARLMGDALLAFFGAPTAHEDDPQRAVRAGLEIVEGITGYREQLQRERGLDFNVRVGVNTGLVFVGAIGADRRVEYTAVGDTMNLAARMEQTARPGSVQITEQTFKLVEPWFEFEPLGGIQVKGKREPVLAYRVLRVKARPGRGRGLEGHGLSAPLVGRDQELERIEACVQHLYEREEGGIVGIIGEAGLGKSRLVAEAKFFASSKRSSVLWLEAQALSFGQTISYWPFQQILRGWAGISEEDDTDTSLTKLESCVRGLYGEETTDYLPYLANLLALEVRGEYAERVKYLDGDAMGKQIFLTSRRFFERLAHAQPMVLIFEDLHWMDESSTLLLEHLLPLVETVPILIFGVSRPERETSAARLLELCRRDFADRYTEVRLAPLSESDSIRLINDLLDIENMPARLRELIVDKADGNPFFLEEVIRTLIDADAVIRDASSGRWRATAQIEAIHIPNTIQGVIMARVDSLDEGLKQVLRMASVIGRSFLYRVLKAITEAGQRLDDNLTELQSSELIHEKQRLPELEYMFKHALAQEATYESVLLTRRRDIHARVARAIESLFTERLEEFYGLLAYHYAKAEVWGKAQEYLFKAGDQAGRMAADTEALSYYRQALTAYEHTFGDKWVPVERAALSRKMGEALFRRGEHKQAFEYLQHALIYLDHPLPTSRWAIRITILDEIIRQIGHRLWPSLFFKQLGEPVSQAVEEEGRIYESLTWIAAVDPEHFLLIVLRMLNFSERNDFRPGIIMGFATLGLIADFMAFFKLARYYFRKAALLADQSQHLGVQGLVYNFRAIHENIQGQWNTTLEYTQRAADSQHQDGYWNVRGWALALSNSADAHIHLGNFTQALRHAQDLVQLGQESGDRQAQCWGLSRQGFAQRGLGRLEEAIESLEEGMELAKTVPDYQTYVDSGGELGQCYLRKGTLEQAFAVFEECRRSSLEHNLMKSPVITRFRNGLAEACLLAVEQSDKNDKRDWLKKAGRACQDALKQGKAYPPGTPEAMMLRGRYEWLRGRHNSARKWWQRSLVGAERMDLRYDLGRTLLEIGERFNEREYLERAEALFTQTVSEWELARAREIMNRDKRQSPTQ
jgi:class 3 adenylate cyclase/tetratricopeptide (TPR) repeat protein